MQFNKQFKRVLVLSPHTDDGELGAGGTIAKFLEEGKEVIYIAFSGCETAVPNGWPEDSVRQECKSSTRVLGIPSHNVVIMNYQVRIFPEHRQQILEDLIRIKNQYIPNLVLLPSSNDMHQDHATIHMEAVRAFKKESSLWGYEHPWNNLTFTTDVFVKLKEYHIESKIKALEEYKSQQEKNYMKEHNIRSLASTRGSQLDIDYAETFELIREIY